MSSQRIAQLGLAAAIGVLSLCVSVLVRGSFDTIATAKLAIGEHVPAFALPDTTGHTIQLSELRNNFVVVLYARPKAMKPAQQAALDDLVVSLRSSVPVEFLAITDQVYSDSSACDVFPRAKSLLIDDRGAIAALLGASPQQPLVCLIDPEGVLRYRTTLMGTGDESSLLVTRERQLRHIRDLIDESPYAAGSPTAWASN
jgi:peroxiredoxin